MKRRWLLCGVLAMLLWPAVGAAQARLGVGFFAPEIPIDPLERFSYARALAQHLTTALGTPVQGFAFKSAEDFRAALRRRQVHYAVLGAFFLSSQRVAKVLATGKGGGGQWTLMGKPGGNLLALKGQTLQIPSVGGDPAALISNGLLGGNLDVRTHFKIVNAPDLKSSLTAVGLGRANLVFAPATSQGVNQLFERTITVPPPAFVQLDRAGAAKAPAAAKAVLAFTQAAGPLQGFGAPRPEGYRRLAGLSAKRTLRMAMVATSVQRLESTLVNIGLLREEYPAVAHLYVNP